MNQRSLRRTAQRLLLTIAAVVVVSCSSDSSGGGATSAPTVQSTAPTTQASPASTAQPTFDPDGSGIDGVMGYVHDGATHVDGPVQYTESPPTGGDHSATWQKCKAYDKPLTNENAVHSLEHGAVWLTYRPDLPAADVAKVAAFADGRTHVLVSPYPGLTAPVVATAWGRQLVLDGADDPRLAKFVRFYENGPQTPEPGVTCDSKLDKATG